jgi:hypothetical protein
MRASARPCLLAAVLLSLAAPPALAQVVQINSNISVNTTWGPSGTVVGTVFWVRNSIGVNAGVTLTIQPGVVVKFDASRSFTVNGALRCIGTGPGSIVFTSIKDDNNGGDTNGDGNATVPNASDWYGIDWPNASTDFASRLHYCDIQYAGTGSGGALTFTSSSDSITFCTIRRSYYGVDCAGTAAPVLDNTSIEASTQTPIVLDFTATPVLSSLVFSSANNGYDAFGLRGATLTAGTFATLPKRGATVGANPVSNVTYVLFGGLTINAGAGLTISPGVVIKPTGAHVLNNFGNLTMNGTAAVGDTITLTSIHDDNFGLPGDTNNNGSITAPAPGNRGYIYFNQGSTGSVSRCRLKFGTTSATLGDVVMFNNSIPVSNSLISDCAHGLAILGISNPAITNVAINNCTSTPILISVSANPVFSGITFLANAITALGLNGEDIAVDSHIAFRDVAGYTNITYYLMNGSVRMLSPAVLTIDPGVVIKNQINGGGFVIDGGLIADGTPAQPIVFTSDRDDQYGNPADTNGDGSTTVPATANWSYIRFTGTSNDAVSILDNCRITYASYGPHDGWNTAVWVTSAAPTITNCFISKATYGIRADGNAAPIIDFCDFNNLNAAPYVMSVLADPSIGVNSTYSTNVYNAIALLSETLSQNARLRYRAGVGVPTFAYLPTGQITVASGVTLAVDPLVVLKPTSSFTVFYVNGALNVVGSDNTTGRVIFTSRRDDNPIYGGDTTPGESSTPQTGDWGNIYFSDTAVDAQCVLRNILFQFGGAGGNDNGTIATLSASPRLVKLEFFQNATAMTFGGNSTPVVDSVNIFNCTQLPIVYSLISDPVFPDPARIVMANNAYTCLGILAETIAQDVTTRVRALGTIDNISYCPTGTISIAFGAKWTIAPGVVIKLGSIFSDPIGVYITVDGALVADGKPDSLIVFTSSRDDAFGNDIRSDGALTTPAINHWYGINFTGISNDAATVIDHVRFRYGGYWGEGALKFTNAGPTITNTLISIFGSYGTSILGNSTPTFTNCQIDSCTNVPVFMSLVSEPVFNNVQFLGNTYTALGVVNESIAQDVLWKIRAVAGRNNMPYLLQGGLTIGLGATLTMQPGVIVKSTGSGSITVQRAFLSEGRTDPESTVVFTSYRDDFYGGDTDNNGNATLPNQSDWNYITIDGTAIDAQVKFRNTIFRYGGSSSTQGALRCINSAPTVDSCMFAYNAVGVSAEGASNPTLRGCSFISNVNYAVNNTGNSFCVNAEGSWWGSATGPSDLSAVADLCGLAGNASPGDRVSNNVDYQPYAATGIVNPLIGDVSLNGTVRAFDASLVLQHLVALVSLSDLQKLVADVSGAGGITALDATQILQFVAGIIPSFPAVSNGLQPVAEDAAAARRMMRESEGSFELSLGAPRRAGDGWEVPVMVSGTGSLYGLDLRLEDGAAARFEGLVLAAGASALHEHNVADGRAFVAIASRDPLAHGEVAVLRFAGPAGDFALPRLAWVRVNETVLTRGTPPAPPVTVPATAFLAAAVPNPSRGPASFSLGISNLEAGTPATVQVLDLAGRTVRTLTRGPLAAGTHAFTWDLRADDGGGVPAGLYFIRARAGRLDATRRLIVVR